MVIDAEELRNLRRGGRRVKENDDKGVYRSARE